MDQVQAVQRPMPMNQPTGVANQGIKKKSGLLKWLIIILVILIVGGLAWWIFTP